MEIKKIKVSNMLSENGRKILNQFIIECEHGEYYQSYQSIIAYRPYDRNLKTVLDVNKWDYSSTTGKYRNQFLDESTAETRQKIADGTYSLENLN